MRRALVLVLVVMAACGSDAPKEVALEKVDGRLVPPALVQGSLVFQEDDKASKAFGRLAKNALVADGKLYAIRQGQRLVATLQVSTLLPEVDLTDRDRYEEVASKLLPGTKSELRVADVPVFEVANPDKVTYVWFGRQMFQVLQVKGTKAEPEEVLSELIGYQLTSPAWDPLPEVVDEL